MSAKNKNDKGEWKIVIVEDSPTQVEQLRYILETHGYRVVAANNGKEALDSIRSDKPNLVISDIVMPEMDGYELCKQIKTDEKLKDIPVILLTALSDPADVIRGLECGADNFLTKPYDEQILFSRIEYLRLNWRLSESKPLQMGVEITFNGQKYFITSDRLQILNLLLSTYESAVGKNRELEQTQAELKRLNEQLEQRVKARNAELAKANEELKIEISERKLAEDRIVHLNSVLRALREINQLITRENDREQLIQQSCKLMFETRGFLCAWILLFDEKMKYISAALSGGEETEAFYKSLKQGIYPPCIAEITAGKDSFAVCGEIANCGLDYLSKNYQKEGIGFISRLEYGGKVYGIISTYLQSNFSLDPEEQSLFKEIAGDIGFALYNIEKERERKQAAEQIEILARFPGENPNPVLRVAYDGLVMYANRNSQSLLEHWKVKVGKHIKEPLSESIKQIIADNRELQIEVDLKGKILSCFLTPVSSAGYINIYGIDITEQKRAENELREEQRRLKEAQALGRIGSWEYDIASQKIVWADETYVLYERNPALGPPTAEEEERYYSIEQAKMLRDYAARSIKNKEDLKYDVEVDLPSGRKGLFACAMHPILNQSGRVLKLFATVQDFTEYKKAEEELKLRAEMLNQASDGIMLRDFDGNLLYANETALRERGYTLEEFFKLNARNLVVAETGSEGVGEWFQEVREKGYRHNEFSVRHKNGSLVPMDAMATKIRLGGKEYLLSVTRNITERKKVEEKLRSLSAVVEQSTEGMAIADLDGNLIFVNDTWCKMHGYQRPEELLGKNLSISHNEEQIENDVNPFNKKVKELGAYSGEVRHITRDGIPFPTLMTTTLLKNEQGKPYAVAGIARDISEQKRMEAERKEMERKAEVASRLASVGEMASGIAHEINNPLTGVVGFAQLLAERKDLPDDVREQLKIIHEGGQRVSNIIKGLLSFARQSKPKRAYIDINEVVEGTLRLSHYELETGNIEVIKQFDPELLWTMADAGQLQQVFINLVVNAQQEMRKAHGKGRLEIKTELVGDMIHISFQDNGPGIAKENLERIFDPFFTTKEAGKGTGLGLSLSHGIIAEHGGQLYAESEPGEGATFVVELPVLAEEVEVEEVKVADETGKAIKGRILVVDDEEVVRQYLNSVLTKMGHIVELAADGEEALDLLKSSSYNLILSDIKMPGMDGKEFYRKVEEIAPSLTGRLVFITGDVMGEDTRDFIRKTGALYLTKPFDAGRLSEVVNNILSGSI